MTFQYSAGRHVKGYIQISEPDKPMVEQETLQCVHCQKHWVVQPGSGIRRGWCFRCMGPSCGKQNCETKCVPAERMIEEIEGKLHGAKNLTLAIERLREPEPFQPPR